MVAGPDWSAAGEVWPVPEGGCQMPGGDGRCSGARGGSSPAVAVTESENFISTSSQGSVGLSTSH